MTEAAHSCFSLVANTKGLRSLKRPDLIIAVLLSSLMIHPSHAEPVYQRPDIVLHGTLSQGGMLVGKTKPRAKVTLDKRAVKVSADGSFVIGFGRNAPPTVKLSVRLPGYGTSDHILHIKQRRYAEQRIDNLDADKVTPPPEVYDRIKHEAQIARVARSVDSDMPYFASAFIAPVKGIITGVYGVRRILNGHERSPHYGVDIAADTGTPIKTPAGGTVTLIHDMYFSGITIIIDHGHGISSTMLHLNEVYVKEGDRLEQGSVIGTVGATGRVTGPHLDWRVNWFEQRLDPQLIVGNLS